MAAWPTLKEVRGVLRMENTDDDAVIDSARLAAIDYGITRTGKKWAADEAELVPDAVHEAALLDAASIYRRRDSADGTIGWGDAGIVRVSRHDPTAERLYEAYAPLVFG
jgi:hypothetical protein